MPLMPGKQNIGRNIEEMERHGHPHDQAVAAALRVARAAGGGITLLQGPIHSAVSGRTDHLPATVASGSYVIPADIISAMGEGNTNAGFKVAKEIFGVHGDAPKYPVPSGTVPVVVAGGEYVITPQEVTHIGEGDMDEGHKILDAFVKQFRAKTIKTLQKLPGPKK